MEWSDVLKLIHIAIAFAFIAGLIGRWVLLRRAGLAGDPDTAHELAEAAAPFEWLVIRGGPAILVAGLLTAWAQGYPWLGLTTGWMLASVVILLTPVPFVPLVFIPRGKVFEAEMDAARKEGVITPGLKGAFADPMVALARRWEFVSVSIVVALMVLKPF